MASALRCSARSRPFCASSKLRWQRSALKVSASAISSRRDLIASAAVAAIAFLPIKPVFASTFAEKALEREQEIEREEEMLEYLLEQQANKRKAELSSEQNLLTKEVKIAEDDLEKQLTATEAGVEAAIAKGDTKTAEVLGTKEAVLVEQEKNIEVAAQQLQAQVDREVLLEKARETSAKQQLTSKVQAAKDDVSEALVAWLEGLANMK